MDGQIMDKGLVSKLLSGDNATVHSFYVRYLDKFPVVNDELYLRMDDLSEIGKALGAHEVVMPIQLKDRPTSGFFRGDGWRGLIFIMGPNPYVDVSKVEAFRLILMTESEGKLWELIGKAKDFAYEEEVDDSNPLIASVNYWYLDRDKDLDHSRHHIRKDEVSNLRPELYPGLDVDCLVREFIKSDERVLILFGEPGVGKTAFIRYMLYRAWLEQSGKEEDKEAMGAAYMKSQDVLENDQLWIQLTQQEPTFVLLDDLDFALLPRMEGRNNPFVNQFLSYSNGIFQPAEGTSKVVITTNQPLEEIDAALVRPGRCFDILQLRGMTKEEAQTLWIDLFENDLHDFQKKFWDKSHVSQAELMSAIKDLDRDVKREYLLDPSMSIRGKYEGGLSLEPKPERKK